MSNHDIDVSIYWFCLSHGTIINNWFVFTSSLRFKFVGIKLKMSKTANWILFLVVLSLAQICNSISDAPNKLLTPRMSFMRFLTTTVRGGADNFEDRRRNDRQTNIQQTRYKSQRLSSATFNNNKYNYEDLRSSEFQDQESSYHSDASYVNEVVAAYTQSTAGKALVAVSSAIATILLVHLFQSILLSHTFWKLNYLAGILAAVFVFLRGDWTQFFRSLGVFCLVILTQTRPQRFFLQLIRQFQAFLYLSERQPFPPSKDDEPEFNYSSFQTFIGNALLGGFMGWQLVKPIPFFPSWLGGLVSALFLGYLSTLSDATGDLLRYLGHTLMVTWNTWMQTAQDVDLKDNTGLILGHTLFFMKDIDQQLQIRRKLQFLMREILSKGTMMFYSMRMSGNNNDNNSAGYSNNGKRYGSNRNINSNYDNSYR